jgi:hypothetical protein
VQSKLAAEGEKRVIVEGEVSARRGREAASREEEAEVGGRDLQAKRAKEKKKKERKVWREGEYLCAERSLLWRWIPERVLHFQSKLEQGSEGAQCTEMPEEIGMNSSGCLGVCWPWDGGRVTFWTIWSRVKVSTAEYKTIQAISIQLRQSI